MMRLVLFVLSLVAATPAATAQAVDTPAESAVESTVESAAAAPVACVIPKGTVMDIEVLEDIRSKKAKSGANFSIRLASPVVIGEWTALPAGLPGMGQVVHAKKAMFLGSAGELVLAARYVMLGETKIPLRSFNLNASGASHRTLTITPGAAMMLDHNSNTEISAGTVAQAKTSVDVVIPCPDPASPAA